MSAASRSSTPKKLASANAVDVPSHQERDGNREPHREHAPSALGESAHDDVSEPGERDDDDAQDGDRRHGAEHRTELVARDFRERSAATARARNEDHEVVHGAAEHDAE
jgi:hypothetical protein